MSAGGETTGHYPTCAACGTRNTRFALSAPANHLCRFCQDDLAETDEAVAYYLERVRRHVPPGQVLKRKADDLFQHTASEEDAAVRCCPLGRAGDFLEGMARFHQAHGLDEEKARKSAEGAARQALAGRWFKRLAWRVLAGLPLW